MQYLVTNLRLAVTLQLNEVEFFKERLTELEKLDEKRFLAAYNQS